MTGNVMKRRPLARGGTERQTLTRHGKFIPAIILGKRFAGTRMRRKIGAKYGAGAGKSLRRAAHFSCARRPHSVRIAGSGLPESIKINFRCQFMKMITGSIVAIVTPMHEDGSLDFPSLQRLIDFHVREGTNAIVVVGTTGESPTVDVEEHRRLIQATVEHTAGRIPVIAGAGANSTSEAVEMTEFAKKVGADAALSVVPYYNKPTQEGLYRHFKTIAETVDIPLIPYNVPSRTVADLSTETTLRLAQIPNIVGIKDATSAMDRGAELINRAPPGFSVYSGEDSTACALMLLGGKGCISVVANVAPRLVSDMCAAALAGDVARARALNFRMSGLSRQLFCETNPGPVKWVCQQLGLTQGGIRLPLTPLSPECHERVRAAMRQAGLLD
jgi:4-hydroxy-tetrahydrodipicolinate synthase